MSIMLPASKFATQASQMRVLIVLAASVQLILDILPLAARGRDGPRNACAVRQAHLCRTMGPFDGPLPRAAVKLDSRSALEGTSPNVGVRQQPRHIRPGRLAGSQPSRLSKWIVVFRQPIQPGVWN